MPPASSWSVVASPSGHLGILADVLVNALTNLGHCTCLEGAFTRLQAAARVRYACRAGAAIEGAEAGAAFISTTLA